MQAYGGQPLPTDRSQMHTGHVAVVNPDDDDVLLYVVRWYAYDPQRRERRHQVVAAFDNKAEFLRSIKWLDEDLQRRRNAGDPVDRQEHFTGITLEPGHRRRQQAACSGRRYGMERRTLMTCWTNSISPPT
jgi:hypothetical protein